MTAETKEMVRRSKMKRALRSAIIGVVLALVCRALPEEYQVPCATVVKACTGSF